MSTSSQVGLECLFSLGGHFFDRVRRIDMAARPGKCRIMIGHDPETGEIHEATKANVGEFTVSEISFALKRTLEDSFGYVRVRGEISGFRGPHSSGHCYFALKDEGAKIEAVIFRSAFARMRLKPEEGLEVFVTGRLTTFPGKSTYQIVIETLELAG